MSDPMTNVEIEDVLSSIRRLVSDGSSGGAQPATTGPRPMPKLVLTPALRVDAPAADASDDHVVLDDTVQVQDTDNAAVETVTVSDAPDRASLLATIAELEAAVREQPDDWEPDGTGTDMDLDWARAGFRGDVEVEDAEEIPLQNAPANAAAWPRTLVEAARRYGGDDAAAPAPDAATGTAAEDDPAPEPEFRHKRSDNIVRADEDDVDFNDELIGGPDSDDDPEDMLDSYLAGAPLLDEAQLREIVREIVRQELQGKLGERITRNVRKLVRREIHRALTTQTFD